MKNTKAIQDTSWASDATNSTGFSARPAGVRYDVGKFDHFDSGAFFWSSTPNLSVSAYYLSVNSSSAFVGTNNGSDAFSVRCIQD